MKRLGLMLVLAFVLVAAVTVQSATNPTGNIKVATPGVVVELKLGGPKPTPVPNGRDVPLPVGTYAPAGIQCFAQDASGKQPIMWSIKSTGPFGSVAKIDVQENALSTVDCGPPFVLKPSIRVQKTPTGTVASIGLSVTGKAGESYNASTAMKGQSVAPPPSLRVVDSSGKVLTAANFTYG